MRRIVVLLATLTALAALALAPVMAQVPDRDGDGIPDDEDLCPDLYAEGGGVDGTGCPMGPDFDTDGDGVPDSLDLCPTIYAEGGGVGGTGCPPEVFAVAGGGEAALSPPHMPQFAGPLSHGPYGPYFRGYPPCGGSLAPRLEIGDRGRIAQRFSTLRHFPAGRAIRVVYAPAEFTVLDGPICAGYGPLAWYLIDYGNGLVGWASESQRYSLWGRNQYWLSPVPSES
jgi:hypothetical protein